MKQIYLDNNATTKLDKQVFEAMKIDLEGPPANPSSVHFFGQRAKNLLQTARDTLAKFLHVHPQEILFTSGGTESIHLALKGFLPPSGHLISTSIDHAALHKPLCSLQKQGYEVSFLETGLWGAISPEELQKNIRSNTKLILLSAVNSETGVKTDLVSIAKIAEDHKIPLIVDGVALLGKEKFSIPSGVSALCFSGHKIHAPKGVGFAFIRAGISFTPSILGGPQEYNKRAGTENLAGILGLAEAISLLSEHQDKYISHMQTLRDYFEKNILENFPGTQINGLGPRVCNTSNLSFEVSGETLLIQLGERGIAVSHGSACASGATEPSRVLLNMGIEKKRAKNALRFSLSRFTTQEEIDQTLEILCSLLTKNF